MEGSAAAVAAVADDGLESWELTDVDASMRRLMLTSGKDSSVDYSKQDHTAKGSGAGSCAGSDSGMGVKPVSRPSEELINTVDQFLREAIQNPRERVSVLRMEQDVEKFIHDPTREQMEFQQLPTSYLRLAAHRVAQHYSLQSMVLLDNSLPDGSDSRIIIRKTSDIHLPLVRLVDIPVNLPTEASGAVKVAIKQRPQIGTYNNSNSYSSAKSNSTRSVEERKDEYNKARARIFNSNSSSGISSGKQESNSRTQDGFQHGSLGKSRVEVKKFPVGGADSSMSNSRLPRSRTEKEPAGRSKTSNRVAIFRDREIDRKDPDYNRSYDRYMQRFDPGFGFTGGPYPIQPMYAPALNYNTEYPHLGSSHRLPIPSDHQPHPIPHQLPAPWVPPSAPAGYGYGPAETMLSPFSYGHVNAHANSSVYLHSAQYPSPRSVLPYIHPLESIHQPFPQSYQQQSDASYGIARPR